MKALLWQGFFLRIFIGNFRKPKNNIPAMPERLPERFDVFNNIGTPPPAGTPVDFTHYVQSTESFAPTKAGDLNTDANTDKSTPSEYGTQPASGKFIGSFKFGNNNDNTGFINNNNDTDNNIQ
jgi:hypothetical protein